MICELIRTGNLGKITTIESRVLGERGVCFGWRADPEYGGGMLYDWGPHLIDQMLQLFEGQRVRYIQARIESVLTAAVDDYTEIIMTFESGVHAKVYISTFALEKLPRWYVFGDKGTMKIDDLSCAGAGARRIKKGIRVINEEAFRKNLGPSRMMMPLAEDSIEELPMPEMKDESLYYWANLIEALEKGIAPEVKPEEVLRVMKVIDAAFQSFREKKILSVDV